MGGYYKLTWRGKENERRWRKYYRGGYYYFPLLEGETKDSSYKRCYAEWIKKRAEIDLGLRKPDQQAWQTVLDSIREEMERVQAGGNTLTARMVWDMLQQFYRVIATKLEKGEEYPGDPDNVPTLQNYPLREEVQKGKPVDGKEDVLPGPAPWDLAVPPWGEKSIQRTVERFLQAKREQAEQGKITKGRYDLLRICLTEFVEVIGGAGPVDSIKTPVLLKYREHLLEKINDRKRPRSPEYASSHLRAVVQFVNWCWEQELLELPRIVKSREFSIFVPEKRIEVFTSDEVTQLLAASPEATKLHLLLMLNCGMLQQDVANLRQEEVDWENGRVTRKRSKTRNHKNVPEVSYPLWPETFRLLKKHRSNHPALALTNQRGKPLKSEEIVKGKLRRIDNIRTAYCRVIRKLAEPEEDKEPVTITKPLKLLRKTAASKLAEHPDYARFAQHFLGHAPRTIADRHYVRPSEEQFDKAVQWLGEQFGIVEASS